VVRLTLNDLAPGAIGDLLTQALRQGTASAREEQGEVALIAGGVTALASGATAMAQFERGANRIYGTERDRPLLRKYLVGLGLACSAGLAAVLALTVLVGGSAIRRAAGWGETFDTAWAIGRWPLGIALAVVAVALLFELSPRRRQPEASWLAFGAGVSVALWLAFVGALKLYVEVTGTFGATYGPVAGTIGVLLWAFASALALLLGLAFAAQLEAVRAGIEAPRVPRDDNTLTDPAPPPAPSPRR
jgi:YihY family inner membrane protein